MNIVTRIAAALGFVPQADLDRALCSGIEAKMAEATANEAACAARSEMWAWRRRVQKAEDECKRLADDLWAKHSLPPLASYYNVKPNQMLDVTRATEVHRLVLEPQRHCMQIACFPEQRELYRRNAKAFAQRWADEFAVAVRKDMEKWLETF